MTWQKFNRAQSIPNSLRSTISLNWSSFGRSERNMIMLWGSCGLCFFLLLVISNNSVTVESSFFYYITGLFIVNSLLFIASYRHFPQLRAVFLSALVFSVFIGIVYYILASSSPSV